MIVAITRYGVLASDGAQTARIAFDAATSKVVYYQNNLGEGVLIVANTADDINDVRDALNSQSNLDAFRNVFSAGIGSMFAVAATPIVGPWGAFSAGLLVEEMYGKVFDGAADMGHWIGQNLPTPYEIKQTVSDWWTAAQTWVAPSRDPLVLDLDADGLETTALNTTNPILFDHDADGVKTATGWIKPDDGFLVWDRNGNGVIDNGRELFGDATLIPDGLGGQRNAVDGFEALSAQDTNFDGKVDANDANFNSLRI